MIETKRITPEDPDVDILEGLFKLEENLPPNSLEFTLSVKPFEYNDDDNESWCSYDDEFEFDIFGNGIYLISKSFNLSFKSLLRLVGFMITFAFF